MSTVEEAIKAAETLRGMLEAEQKGRFDLSIEEFNVVVSVLDEARSLTKQAGCFLSFRLETMPIDAPMSTIDALEWLVDAGHVVEIEGNHPNTYRMFCAVNPDGKMYS